MTYVLEKYLLCTVARYSALCTDYLCAAFRGSVLNKDPCCGYTSVVNSKRQHPRENPLGIFFEVVKSLALGKMFLQKAPETKKHLPRRSILEDLVSLSVNRGRNFGILQKSNLEKNWKAVQLLFGHALWF